jgi:hypothetical protein
MLTSAAVPVWVTEVAKSYEEDEKCKNLIQQLTVAPMGTPNTTFTNGLLRYKGKLIIGSSTALRDKIVSSLHNSELGGHSGEKATYQRIKLLFHWTSMKQQVIDYIKQCPVCQINKTENCKYPGMLQPLLVPDFASTHIRLH